MHRAEGVVPHETGLAILGILCEDLDAARSSTDTAFAAHSDVRWEQGEGQRCHDETFCPAEGQRCHDETFCPAEGQRCHDETFCPAGGQHCHDETFCPAE
eukprot:1162112-Pelagomonas_calceolata.AAC.7